MPRVRGGWRTRRSLRESLHVCVGAAFAHALGVAQYEARGHAAGLCQLEAALRPYRRPPFAWTEVEPSLEDVFIQMMSGRDDRYAQ